MYAAWTRRIERIERNVDRAASALFAASCGYAAFMWLRLTVRPVLAAETAAAFVLAYILSVRALRAVKPPMRKVPVPIFDIRDVAPIDPVEAPVEESLDQPASLEDALAEAASRHHAPATEAPHEDAPFEPEKDALVLDDILAELGPDSRVVRLFDPKSMPTAGELQSRIDRHLDGDAAAAQTSDAAQALHDALAELRRSIR